MVYTRSPYSLFLSRANPCFEGIFWPQRWDEEGGPISSRIVILYPRRSAACTPLHNHEDISICSLIAEGLENFGKLLIYEPISDSSMRQHSAKFWYGTEIDIEDREKFSQLAWLKDRSAQRRRPSASIGSTHQFVMRCLLFNLLWSESRRKQFRINVTIRFRARWPLLASPLLRPRPKTFCRKMQCSSDIVTFLLLGEWQKWHNNYLSHYPVISQMKIQIFTKFWVPITIIKLRVVWLPGWKLGIL